METVPEALAPLSTGSMYWILIGWALLLIVIVLIVGRAKGKTADLFLTAGGGVGHGMIHASLTATWLWAAAFTMASWIGWTHGFVGNWWYCFGAGIPLPIMAYMTKKVKSTMPKARSMPEFIFYRLDNKNQLLFSFFALFTAAWLAVMIIQCIGSLGVTFSTAPYWGIAVITGITFFAYIMVAGLWSAVFADTIMAMAIMVVTMVLFFAVFGKIGVTNMYNALLEVMKTKPVLQPGPVEMLRSQWTPLNWLAPLALGFLVVNLVGNLGGLMVNQAFWSRMTASVDDRTSWKSFHTAGFSWWVIPFSVAFALGVGGLALGFKVGEVYTFYGTKITFAQPDSISALMSFWGLGYLGLICFFIGVAACSISTGAGVILGGVTVVTNNIIKGWLKPDATDKQILLWSRMFLVFYTAFVVLVVLLLRAINFGFPGMYQALGVGVSSAVAPLIMLIFWKSINRDGVFWGVILGAAVGIGYWVFIAKFDLLWGVVWGNILVMGISFLITFFWTIFAPQPFDESTLKDKCFDYECGVPEEIGATS